MNLLLTGSFNYSDEQFEKLRSFGCTVHFMQQEMDALPIPAGNVDAVICNGLFLYHNIDDFVNLRYIQLTSAGLDRVPLEKIKARCITIHNARGVYNIPMAEWVLFRVLEHYKQGWFFKNKQEDRAWIKHRGLRELSGSKVAVIGAGNVGQEVAKLFKSFGTVTCGFDIHTNKTPYFDSMSLTNTLEEQCGEFDIVIVTAPLTSSTYHLLSKNILLNLKDGATLINIARGGLIDENALCGVLEMRTDLFVALDVFETEPLSSESPLWQLDNVALSPHNSFVSDKNNERMFEVIYQNLKHYIN